MTSTARDLPGFVSVKGASDRLRLAPRSVRDLIYVGRLPSTRLGRRHYLRLGDVEAERRRRLGLPLPARRGQRPTRTAEPSATVRPALARVDEVHHDIRASHLRPGRGAVAPVAPVAPERRSAASLTRRRRAALRADQFERWLRSGHRPAEPALPFGVEALPAPAACGACGRALRSGVRVVNAEPMAGREAARLCLTCARRTLLAWSDERRREAQAARRLARDLSLVPTDASPLAQAA